MKFKRRSKLKQPALLWTGIAVSGLLLVTVLLPAVVVKQQTGTFADPHGTEAVPSSADMVLIPVYLSKQKQIQTVSLEQYVKGVVAAEMPAEFSEEALKAQAIAARTYIVRRILTGDFSNVPVKEAWVTDTIQHQAYLTDDQLQKQWTGKAYESNSKKIDAAVKATADFILTYEGKPIQATFFSTSNGYTEDVRNVWGSDLPYLKSVSSPWDEKISPKFKQTITLSYKDILQKLGLPASSALNSGSIKVLERTESKRVKSAVIAGKTFTGKEIREKLGLNSTDFEAALSGTDWTFTVKGYGHGVGMSQWGANGMAKEGKKAAEIAAYYYPGAKLASASTLLNKKTQK
ncbi:stage II sporulation protein D [Paenibacillus chitinolyticus]|uniref:stage II sporulation protein D n=1 Tax=Paenibacillus chitinolyticus TaxID=79263 RepID=UPI0026E49926|nr:stage II sporulation protein D [Paenibacillus chitinolyticus]GKS14077.1 stage II sporulation protein D [Paenibacillus chitinolyticus]